MNDKKYKIILVDDDKFLLNMYSMKFKKEGMDISAFSDPLDALEKIKAGLLADIVILDIVMPGMDGIELLSKIKDGKLLTNAVFIVLSNQGQQSDIDRAKQFGIEGYIVKATTIPSDVLKEVVKIAKDNGK